LEKLIQLESEINKDRRSLASRSINQQRLLVICLIWKKILMALWFSCLSTFQRRRVNCSQKKAAKIQFYKIKKKHLSQIFMWNSFRKKLLRKSLKMYSKKQEKSHQLDWSQMNKLIQIQGQKFVFIRLVMFYSKMLNQLKEAFSFMMRLCHLKLARNIWKLIFGRQRMISSKPEKISMSIMLHN